MDIKMNTLNFKVNEDSGQLTLAHPHAHPHCPEIIQVTNVPLTIETSQVQRLLETTFVLRDSYIVDYNEIKIKGSIIR
jgi:hypothetical protein